MDRDELAQELGFTREDIDLLMEMFEKNARRSLSEMKEAIGENDLNKISHAAHAIKGIAGNLKMKAIFTLTQKIDSMARAEQNEDYATFHQRLTEAVDLVL